MSRRRWIVVGATALLVLIGLGVLREIRARQAPEVRVPAAIPRADPAALRRPLGAAVRLEPAVDDPAYLRAFVSTFTLMIPESAMAWTLLEPHRGDFRWARTDELFQLARRTGKRIRGVLIWDELLPSWLTRTDWEPEELRKVLDDQIGRVVRRYGNRADEWIVVNEPLADDGSLEPNLWLRALGPGWIEQAFRAAHALDPDSELILNEIAAERPPKLDGLVALARRLKRTGVPVDGVGFQYHTDLAGAPRRAELVAAFRRVTRLGLDVYVTEADVELAGDPDPATLRAQARAYRGVAEACLAVRRCRGITVWGVTDRYSWKGADAHPLLFDGAGRAKPALEALLAPLRR